MRLLRSSPRSGARDLAQPSAPARSLRSRRRTLFLVAAALALAAGLAASCDGSEENDGNGHAGSGAGTAGANSGGSSAKGGTAGSVGGGGTISGGGTAAGGSGALGTKCPWEGWYVAPRLPPGCNGLCIPDDVALRVPKIQWLDKPSWCAGCKWLAKPDWTPPLSQQPFSSSVIGAGPGVRMLGFSFEDLQIGVLYDQQFAPVAAWRRDTTQLCGGMIGAAVSRDGHYGLNFITEVFESFDFVMRPIDKVGELMTATDTTLVFPKQVIGNTTPSPGLAFSTKKVGCPLLGRLAIGDIPSQSVAFADTLTGAPGKLLDAEVVGDVVFASWSDGIRYEWWVFANGSFQRMLGGPGKNVFIMVADPSVMVWLEGSEPVDSGGDVIFSRYDLYRAPFTADPALLKPELLLAKFHPDMTAYLGLSPFSLANGFVAFTYTVGLPVEKRDALAVRLSDGKAWHSKLPDDYQWGSMVFAGPDELWGAADSGTIFSEAEAIIRIPYAAMEVIQTAPPAGDSGL